MTDAKPQIKSFRDLDVWRKAHQLVLGVYKATDNYPKTEQFGLVSQIRRAAVSVPANIAEGGKRGSKKEFIHFVHIAEGSLEELKYHLLLSKDLAFLSSEVFISLNASADEVGRMLNGLKKSLLSKV